MRHSGNSPHAQDGLNYLVFGESAYMRDESKDKFCWHMTDAKGATGIMKSWTIIPGPNQTGKRITKEKWTDSVSVAFALKPAYFADRHRNYLGPCELLRDSNELHACGYLFEAEVQQEPEDSTSTAATAKNTGYLQADCFKAKALWIRLWTQQDEKGSGASGKKEGREFLVKGQQVTAMNEQVYWYWQCQ